MPLKPLEEVFGKLKPSMRVRCREEGHLIFEAIVVCCHKHSNAMRVNLLCKNGRGLNTFLCLHPRHRDRKKRPYNYFLTTLVANPEIEILKKPKRDSPLLESFIPEEIAFKGGKNLPKTISFCKKCHELIHKDKHQCPHI